MNRDEARSYFKESSLTYELLTEADIDVLWETVERELRKFQIAEDPEKMMGMVMRKTRKKDVKILKRSGLQFAYLKINGSYFEGREAISFQRNGFIGFGGELSDRNVKPILEGFCRWCDITSKQIMRNKQTKEPV